nr:MBL fold metallo-hydrolase [Bradyrhizobium sp. CCBAU 53421]
MGWPNWVCRSLSGIGRFVRLAGLWDESRAPIRLQLAELKPGPVLDGGEFIVGCFPVHHPDTDSYAFVFDSPARRHIRPDRLAALKVPDGPIRRDLAEGRPISLADGRVIVPENVLGPPEGGTKLVVIGDAETTDGLAEHVRAADLLVMEATFLARDTAMARDSGHLTATEAASLAAASGVKQLVLTHISGRYPDKEILEEATRIFPNSRVAIDLDRIAL